MLMRDGGASVRLFVFGWDTLRGCKIPEGSGLWLGLIHG